MNYNKAGNEMLEVCLFCIYFELGIFHYLIGTELCLGANVHVFLYLSTTPSGVSRGT